MRSLVVACLAFAGVFMLAGPGWALLAGAGLVAVAWRREPDWRSLEARARRWATVVRAAPKRAVAVGGMGAAVVLLATGFALALGSGAGLVAGGGSLAGVALLTGWGA
jgi:hypothetical protein